MHFVAERNATTYTLDLTALFTEIQRLREGADHDYPHGIELSVIEQVYHLTDAYPDAMAVELVWIDQGEGEPPSESVQVTPR